MHVPQPTSFEKLLVECDEMMHGNSPALKREVIESLARYHDDQVTDERRQRYQQIIKDRQLFRDDKSLTPDMQDILYSALLRNAFGMPLTYDAYCQVENCAVRMHKSLLRTIRAAEIPDVVLLLVNHALGEETTRIPGGQDAPAIILARSVNQLRPHHGTIVYQISLRDLHHQPADVAQDTLYRAFYLGPTLRTLYPRDPEARLAQLQALLRLCYGKTLDRQTIRHILGAEVLSADLQYAVTLMTPEPEDVKFAQQFFSRAYAARAYPESSARLQAVLPDEYRIADGHVSDDPSAPVAAAHPRRRHKLREGMRKWHRDRNTAKVPPDNPLANANLPSKQVSNGKHEERRSMRIAIIIALTFAALFIGIIAYVVDYVATHG